MSKASKQAVLNSSVEMIREYYEKEHKHNKDRIKYGIIAMLIIPIVFLILLFVVNSSKVIFLVMSNIKPSAKSATGSAFRITLNTGIL